MLNYDTFIVTSNYSINDLDITSVDKEALLARFEVHHFSAGVWGGHAPNNNQGGFEVLGGSGSDTL